MGVLIERSKIVCDVARAIASAARVLVVAASVLLPCVSAYSQPAHVDAAQPVDGFKPLQIGSLTISGELRGRGQGWNWFLGDTRTRYAFGSTVLNLGLSQQLGKIGWKLEFSQPALYNLPADAFQPGTGLPLGLGPIYFAANRNRRNIAGIFLKQGYLSIKGIDRNHSLLRIGRFEFSEGREKTPREKDLAWLTQERIAQRLIGDSEWTGISRSFDGVHFSEELGTDTNLTFAAGRAASGVWQADGMGELDVDILYGAYTREFTTAHTHSRLRLFRRGYHDGRGALSGVNWGRSLAQ